MDLKIKGKVAVVAAASRGLGRAAAEALAAEGVNLAICSRDGAVIRRVGEEIQKTYKVDVLAMACDVTDPQAIEDFKNKVLDHFHACHILLANAGGPPPGKVEAFSVDDFEKALQINLLSTIRLVYAFLPSLKKGQWGRILASTSISVKQPLPHLALSNVSRVGVIAFIKTLSGEVAPFNITANCLAPGYIMTARVEQLLQDQAKREGITYEQALAKITAAIPAGKIGQPGQFGALCAFLASEQAAYITGETVLIDGGMYRGLM